MATFVPDLPLDGLKGADYNPRRIDETALVSLRHSIARLGMCKPIIVSGKLIIAGHQRTKSMRAIGVQTAPAIVLNQVTVEDEIRFNQLHNGTDFDAGDENATVGPAGCEPFGYEMVATGSISCNFRGKMANIRTEICKLMVRYGNWGGCVATMSGKVIHAAQYTIACRLMALPCRVFRIPDEIEAEAAELLGKQYGVFSYDHLERKTYIQTYAQMMRLRTGGAKGKSLESRLYEGRVLPALKPGDRVLDFGCGQADYVKMLRERGQSIFGIELFFRAGQAIDGAAVHRMIDTAARDLEKNGLFDVVVCDSVLNSVDSLQAEADVLTCVNAFCRPGGKIWFSGRALEHIEGLDRSTMNAGKKNIRYVEFLDEHGFSALFRNGNWFYQKFHSKAQAESLALRYIGPTGVAYKDQNTSWSIGGVKSIEVDEASALASIGREFDLIWPNQKSVGRAALMSAAWTKARNISRQTASSGTL